MTNRSFETTRRQVLAGLGATTALTLGGCAAVARPDSVSATGPDGATQLLESIGQRLLELAEHGYQYSYDHDIQAKNLAALAREFGERSFESGTRRQFVKAAVGLLDRQRREGESSLDEDGIRELTGASGTGPAMMPGESEF